MTLSVVMWEWLSFAVRWFHVIAGIAWIGSSFYFIALDLGLRRHARLPDGVKGEEWQVHGGGFYHVQKYMVAPPHLPEDLVWFKWESYATWLSGFALLAVVYYASADLYLIDYRVLDLHPWQAIALSAASLAVGYGVYDQLCKSPLGRNDTALMLALFVLLAAASYGYTQVFSGRAALLHVGALTATIMSANVFFIIIPNQTIVVGDLKAGHSPDPKYGEEAKQRSVHNNYLTLPVLFLMLSNHYPLAFASEFNWAIACLVFLMGVTIRHYVNSIQARTGNPIWTWPATAAIFAAIILLSTVQPPFEDAAAAASEPKGRLAALAASPHFDEVETIVLAYCAACHAAEPGWPGLATAPKGVRLETREDILREARRIYLQAALSRAMPPPNVSFMEPSERAAIARWFESAGAAPAEAATQAQALAEPRASTTPAMRGAPPTPAMGGGALLAHRAPHS